jgi:amino acid adenylation domain-containing protein
MRSTTRFKSLLGPYWKASLADLQTAGILRGMFVKPPERAPVFTHQTQVPLAPRGTLFADVPEETVMLAAWATVLARHTSSADVLFYTSFDHEDPWLAPLRLTIPAQTPLAEWVIELEKKRQEAEQIGPMPAKFAAQARDEGLDRSLPAFIVVPRDAKAFPPRDQIKNSLLVVARLDISMLEIHYDSGFYESDEIQALGDHLNIVLLSMVSSPKTAVGHLPILTDAERKKMLVDWNKTQVPFEENTCVHQFFEQQARRTPDAVAIVFCDREWTYKELNEQADLLATRLRAAGVKPGTFVSICVNRSLELMATLLAVLKAGGAYVPLDPAYPPERLAFMVEDAKPAVIAVSKNTAESFAGTEATLFFVDDEADAEVKTAPFPPADVKSSDAAYVLYTSGSTGKPKGVVITHRNVSNFITAMDGVIGTEVGVWLAVTSVNFDISVFELFWTLARGFRIILQEEGQWVSQSGSKYSLPQQMRRHGVTHLQCTPSLASMLIIDSESVEAIKPLRRFMVGGEPLPLDLAQRLTEIISGDLFNLYGPTETTVWSASQIVPRQEKQIYIGRPVANNTLYVLDPERQLVPIGSAGELYIGGDGLAREYLHRTDITAERFITHAFVPGQPMRLYRTGDVVRHIQDGRLQFMGRTDQQIKIRGVRVELGEIEVVLREHDDVGDAVVVAMEDGTDDKKLVGYVVPMAGKSPNATGLQAYLGTKLPKAVVPSAIVFLSEFPKTPNGKLDRRALPKPDQITTGGATSQDAGTDLERKIATIWCEVLGVDTVGLDERFYDLGGTEALVSEVRDHLREKASHDIPLLDLFQYPTVRSLAKHIEQRSPAATNLTRTASLTRGKLRQQLVARQNSLRKAAILKKSS